MKQRVLLVPAVLGLAAVAACGSSTASSAGPSAPPAPTTTSSVPTTPPSSAPASSPTPSAGVTGAKSATCVNGWTDAPAGSDFFGQAEQAVSDTLKGTHQVKAVRYFAGPLVAGGVGAVYYVELADPQPGVRLVVVSGSGPSSYAVAPAGTHGWTDGDWTGFSGTGPPAAHPPLPGTWPGSAFNPVTGASALLSPQLAGCLAGT